MFEKYCGICGRTEKETKLRYFKSTPDGDKLHVCVDRKSCDKVFKSNLKKSFGKSK